MILEDPIMTEMMFPKAESAMRKLRARDEFLEPKTAVKKSDAASCFEVFREAFGTEWIDFQ